MSPPPDEASEHDSETTQVIQLPQQFVRHHNFEGELNEPGQGPPEDYLWTIERVGREPDFELVRFTSVNHPGRALRHKNFRIILDEIRDDETFRRDSTFRVQASLVDAGDDGWRSYESVNFDNHYLAHINFHLYLRKNDDTSLFHEDASFKPE